MRSEQAARQTDGLTARLSRFVRKPLGKQYIAIALKLQARFPSLPIPVRLPFGAWWLAGTGTVDRGVLLDGFESGELRFVERFVKPRMTILDIGAHHGLYTILASKRTGTEGCVHAFEPSPRERAQLKRNIKLNRCRNVRIHAQALGNAPEKATLHLVDGTEDGCNSLRAPNVAQPTTAVEVEVRTLDDFLQKSNIQKIDFMKLDVEGAELSVLEGACEFFNGSQRPVILAEISDVRTGPWGYAAREIIGWLAQRRYEWFALTEKGKLEPAATNLAAYDHNLVAVPIEQMRQLTEFM